MSSPARVYTYTYLNSSAYTSRYIYNRLTQATLGIANQNIVTLAANTYDGQYFQQAPSGVQNWDTSYASVTARGDVTSWTTASDYGTSTYDQTGNVVTASQDGVTTQVTTTAATNYAAPSQLSVGGLTSSIDWSSFLGPTSVTGPNGDSSSVTYDYYGRPATSTSPFGAQTTYANPGGPSTPSNPAITEVLTNSRWTKTILDGLGRAITVQTGNGPTTISQTETIYGSCGCSPTGKMIQQSLPHAPNVTPVWTTYTYDGIGRTVSVVAPDGFSTTTYVYLGNTVKVTDPAGKWKIFTMDAFGHFTQVDEPNPSSGTPPPLPVSPPSFNPAPGSYSSSLYVTLSSTTSGASIRYTTNGTMPSETAGTLYSGAILVSSTTTINAIALETGMSDSAVTSATYTIGSGGSGTAWYSTAWGYRKQIIIASSQVSGSSNLTNFPVLISLPSDSNLASSAESNGNDILFTAADGLTKLNHEIETYTSSNGQLNAWVNVPSVSPTANTVIYMYYGNSSAPNQQSPAHAWDSNFIGVWHLPNGSTLSANDSTANANNGSISGAGAVSGEIGGGASFNGSSSNISVGNASSVRITGPITMSAWVNVAAFPQANNWSYIIGKGYDGTNEGYFLRLTQNGSVIQLNAGSDSAGNNQVLWPISGWNTNTWHHVVGTYDGTNWNVYLDGALKASATQAIGAIPSSLGVYLGGANINGTLTRFWNGDLDEVHLSNIARSPDWIKTEYNNQSSPSSFSSLGTQQTPGGGSGSGTSWYNTAWSYRKQIIIPSSQVLGSSNLANFPVLITWPSDSNLIAPAVQTNGNDILFTASDGVTKLNHEIEVFTSSTGQLSAWVNVPSLSPTANTSIYMYYGNGSAGNEQNSTAVWNSNYVGVYHFPSNTTLSANDSTANGNNPSALNGTTAAAGKIGGAASFNGTSNEITIPGTLGSLATVTLEGWVNKTSSASTAGGMTAIGISGGAGGSDGRVYIRTDWNVNLGFRAGYYGAGEGNSILTNTSIGGTGWHHVALVVNPTSSSEILYIDGVSAGTTNTNYAIDYSGSPGNTTIGSTPSAFLQGFLDEVRISNIALTPAWILTEYNNQNSPSNFFSVSSQQTQGSGGGYLTPVGMPTFSPAPGTYSSAQTVTISTSTSGATIRYTTNGSAPSETSGAVYTGPITVANSATIKSIAYESGMADSEISAATYVITGSSGGGDYLTYYTYDGWDNLAQVSMPRPSGTQTRTFKYSGKLLISATNPENGTVTYTYNSYNKVATKTDAKGQAVVYTYDSIARLIKVQRYPTGTSGAEDTCQQENYYYDSNPFNSNYSQYSLGRLAAVQYYAPASGGGMSGCASGGGSVSTIAEQYSYNQGGAKVNKGVLLTRTLQSSTTSGPFTLDLESSYTYDNEGRMLSVQYPGSTGGSAGPNLGYVYDSMGRLNTMTDLGASNTLISATTYDPANRLLTIVGSVYNEGRTYNGMGQLTALWNNSVNMFYNYSATQNNGKIVSQTDQISGEQLVYAYDALNRLASASTTAGTTWGQSYSYDGFGNLTNQTVTAGTAPSLSVAYNTNNQQTTDSCVDANGNINSSTNGLYACLSSSSTYGYDVSNRIVTVPGGTAYAYAPGNKRVWRGTTTLGHLTLDELTFWSVTGQKLATYTIYGGDPTVVYSPPSMAANLATTNYYFGRKLIKNANGYIGSDRLGSIGRFYPWGQEKPSATTNGTEKFTGYFRDAETGLDYAKNRYHQPGMGRFLTPDPYQQSAGPQDPGSWNRYAYASGDPIKYKDPRGREECDPDEGDDCGPNFTADGYCYDCDDGGGGGDDDYCSLYPDDPGCFVPPYVVVTADPPQTSKPPKKKKPAPTLPQIVCDKSVIAAMAQAWQATGNGTSGTEAGFSVQGSPSNPAITYAPSNNTHMSNTIPTPPGTVDIFHVHPNGGDPAPSQHDITVGNQTGFDMFTFSSSGLYEYDPSTQQTVKLRNGLDWLKPCPQN